MTGQNLEERLNRLEKKVEKHSKSARFWMGVSCLLLIVVLGLVVFWRQGTVAAKDPGKVEKLILRDPAGKARMALMVNKDGPFFMMADKEGRARIGMLVPKKRFTRNTDV